MAAEKLIPVLSESEVRIGAIHVVKACRRCDGTRDHRFMVTGKADWPDGLGGLGGWYRWAPAPGCGFRPNLTHFDFAIPEGRLFRVEDGLDDKPEVADEVRPRKKETARG